MNLLFAAITLAAILFFLGLLIFKHKFLVAKAWLKRHKKAIAAATIAGLVGGSGIFLLIPDTPPGSFVNSDDLGYEFLDGGAVIHVWNKHDSYYFNTSNAIQFSNHYNEYWTKNVMMLGYLTGGDITDPDNWNLIYRTDELSDFEYNFTGETDNYLNATLWKDLSYSTYDFRLAIRYHLKADDRNLTVIPYVKNLGIPIPFTLGFGWEMKDIKINNITSDNYFRHENHYNSSMTYNLHNDSLNNFYTNLTKASREQWCNGTKENCTWDNDTNTEICDCNGTVEYNETWQKETRFYLDYWGDYGIAEKTLYLDWSVPKGWYAVSVKARTGQYNAPTTLFLKIGSLSPGQEKSTVLHWYDADITWGDPTEPYNADPSVSNICKVSTNKVVIVYCEEGTSDGEVRAGYVNGTSIIWGSSVMLDTDVRVGSFPREYMMDICPIDHDKFVAIYLDDTDNDGEYKVGTIGGADGLTISLGAAYEPIDNHDLIYQRICQLDTNLVASYVMDKTGAYDGWGIISSISGTAITEETSTELTTSYTTFNDMCRIGELGSNKFIVTAAGDTPLGNDGVAAVGEYSGGSLSWGSLVDFSNNNNIYTNAVCSLNDTHQLIVYTDTIDDDISATIVTVSGTTLTTHSIVDIDTGVDGLADVVDVVAINETQAVAFWIDSGNNDKGMYTILNISGTTITVGETEIFNNDYTGGIGDLSMEGCSLTYNDYNNYTKVIVVYDDNGDDQLLAEVGEIINRARTDGIFNFSEPDIRDTYIKCDTSEGNDYREIYNGIGVLNIYNSTDADDLKARVGEDKETLFIERSFITINTSEIHDGVTLTGAYLWFYPNRVEGDGAEICLHESNHNYSLTTGDFVNTMDLNSTLLATRTCVANTWTNFSINTSVINVTGDTKLCFREMSKDYNYTAPGGSESYGVTFGSSFDGYPYYLIITYDETVVTPDPPVMDTAVDQLGFYRNTTGTVPVTVTSNEDTPDNVTLYYRYSDDNTTFNIVNLEESDRVMLGGIHSVVNDSDYLYGGMLLNSDQHDFAKINKETLNISTYSLSDVTGTYGLLDMEYINGKIYGLGDHPNPKIIEIDPGNPNTQTTKWVHTSVTEVAGALTYINTTTWDDWLWVTCGDNLFKVNLSTWSNDSSEDLSTGWIHALENDGTNLWGTTAGDVLLKIDPNTPTAAGTKYITHGSGDSFTDDMAVSDDYIYLGFEVDPGNITVFDKTTEQFSGNYTIPDSHDVFGVYYNETEEVIIVVTGINATNSRSIVCILNSTTFEPITQLNATYSQTNEFFMDDYYYLLGADANGQYISKHTFANLTGWRNFSIDYDDWEYSFTCPNGTGYYELCSIGQASNDGGATTEEFPQDYLADEIFLYNNLPTISGEQPTNSSIDIVLQPAVGFTPTDTDGNFLNITFQTNVSGKYVDMQTNTSVASGTGVNWTFDEANTELTMYFWKVEVDDGHENVTEWFFFTTAENDTLITYQETVRYGGYDYFTYLGGNITASDFASNITNFDAADESIAVWHNGTWDDINGNWQMYYGDGTGTDFTFTTFDIVRINLSGSGTQVIDMEENPNMNYTKSKTNPLRNFTHNKGYNYTGSNMIASTTLSAINTSIGLEKGEAVMLWNETNYNWDTYISGFELTDRDVHQWDVVATKVEDNETWVT